MNNYLKRKVKLMLDFIVGLIIGIIIGGLAMYRGKDQGDK